MKSSVRRATVILALTPVVCAPGAAALAAGSGSSGGATVSSSQPAPPADATGVAATVDGVVTVGRTATHAGSDGGSAHAGAIEVGGTTVVGGDQKGAGSQSDALLDSGATPLGRAQVAPWSTSVSRTPDGWSSTSSAALAHLEVDNLADVWALRSQSRSGWTAGESRSRSSSEGAEVNLGDGALDLVLLYSEASSGSKGHSALVVVNGNEIGSSDQANGRCSLGIQSLLDVSCLTATGGTGSNGVTTSTGRVAQAKVADGKLPGAVVSGSTARGGKATPVAAPRRHNRRNASPLPHTSAPGGLPYTGAELGLLAAYGAALSALGTAMVAAARRRRRGLAGGVA